MNSKNRVVRVIGILEYLRTLKYGTTCPNLSERFGVSVRQIYRDLDTLRDAGIAIDADQGVGGGIRLNRISHVDSSKSLASDQAT